jgi:hypothetical protein
MSHILEIRKAVQAYDSVFESPVVQSTQDAISRLVDDLEPGAGGASLEDMLLLLERIRVLLGSDPKRDRFIEGLWAAVFRQKPDTRFTVCKIRRRYGRHKAEFLAWRRAKKKKA